MSQPGFTSIADKQLLDLVQQVKPRNMGKYVFLLLDEMYIKEGLVYNKSTGALIGFSDLTVKSLLTKTLLIRNQDTTLTEQYPLSNVTKYFRHIYTN